MLNLRSAPSGTPFLGEAAGDVVQWDPITKKFFVGQLARASCAVMLSSNSANANFNSGGNDTLGYLQPNVQFQLEGTDHFELDDPDASEVGGVVYTGPTVTAFVTFCGSFSFGVGDAGEGAIGIAHNGDVVGVDYGDGPAVRAGVTRVRFPLLDDYAIFSAITRRRVTLVSGDKLTPVGALNEIVGSLDMISYALTVEA